MSEPFEPVDESTITALARSAQSRIDGSVGAPSMIVGCYTLAALCAEVSVRRALEAQSSLQGGDKP
jgi:hypothetical protein